MAISPLTTKDESQEKLGTYTIIQRANSTHSSICNTPSTILESAFSRMEDLDDDDILVATLRSKIDRINEELAMLYKDAGGDNDIVEGLEDKHQVETIAGTADRPEEHLVEEDRTNEGGFSAAVAAQILLTVEEYA